MDESLGKNLGEAKKKIIYLLKISGGLSMESLSKKLRISKVAILKHIKKLEERGLVERKVVRAGIGRPKHVFRLTPRSSIGFPPACSQLSVSLLKYIEERIGRKGVRDALMLRQEEVYRRYINVLKGLGFDERVKELARLRDEEGYMAEVKKSRKGGYILTEHNCPILGVSSYYNEACSLEKELFEMVLEANIEVTHRISKGDSLCKFLIRRRFDR